MTKTLGATIALALTVALLAAACGSDPTGEEALTTSTAPRDRVVLDDPFDDDSNGWVGDVTQWDGAPLVPAIEGGSLLLSGVEDGSVLDLWPDAIATEAGTLGDQRVEATVSLTTPGAAHVACRLDPAADGPTMYVATASSGGFYLVQKVRDGRIDGPEFLATAPASVKEQAETGVSPADAVIEPLFDGSSGEGHHLALTCTGGEDGSPVSITLSDGGEEVATAEDAEDPLLTGIGSVGAAPSAVTVAREGFEPYGVAVADFVLTDLGG